MSSRPGIFVIRLDGALLVKRVCRIGLEVQVTSDNPATRLIAPVRADRVAGKSVHAQYVNGLAGAMALMIAGGQADKEDIIAATVAKLRECIERDLRFLGK